MSGTPIGSSRNIGPVEKSSEVAGSTTEISAKLVRRGNPNQNKTEPVISAPIAVKKLSKEEMIMDLKVINGLALPPGASVGSKINHWFKMTFKSENTRKLEESIATLEKMDNVAKKNETGPNKIWSDLENIESSANKTVAEGLRTDNPDRAEASLSSVKTSLEEMRNIAADAVNLSPQERSAAAGKIEVLQGEIMMLERHVEVLKNFTAAITTGMEKANTGIENNNLQAEETMLQEAQGSLREAEENFQRMGNIEKPEATAKINELREKIGELEANINSLKAVEQVKQELHSGTEYSQSGLQNDRLENVESSFQKANQILTRSMGIIDSGTILDKHRPLVSGGTETLQNQINQLGANIQTIKTIDTLSANGKDTALTGISSDNLEIVRSSLQTSRETLNRAEESFSNLACPDKTASREKIDELKASITGLEAHVQVVEEFNTRIESGSGKITAAIGELATKEISNLNIAETLLQEAEEALANARLSFQNLGNIDKNQSATRMRELEEQINDLKTNICQSALTTVSLKATVGMSGENKSIHKLPELKALLAEAETALTIAAKYQPEEAEMIEVNSKITDLSNRITILTNIGNTQDERRLGQLVANMEPELINDYIENISEKVDVCKAMVPPHKEETQVNNIINNVFASIPQMEDIRPDTLLKIYSKVDDLIRNIPADHLQNPLPGLRERTLSMGEGAFELPQTQEKDYSRAFLLNSVNSLKNEITGRLFEAGISEFKQGLQTVGSPADYQQKITELEVNLGDLERQITALDQGRSTSEISGTGLENVEATVLKDSLVRLKNIMLKEAIMNPFADFETAHKFAAYTGSVTDNFSGSNFNYATAVNQGDKFSPGLLTENDDSSIKNRIRELYKQESAKGIQLKPEITQSLFHALENLKEGKFSKDDYEVLRTNFANNDNSGFRVKDSSTDKFKEFVKVVVPSFVDRNNFGTWTDNDVKILSEALEKQLRPQIPSRMKETPIFLKTVSASGGHLDSVENIMKVTVDASAKSRPPLSMLLEGAETGATASVQGKATIQPDGTVEVLYKVSLQGSVSVTLPDYNLPKLGDILPKLDLEIPNIDLPELPPLPQIGKLALDLGIDLSKLNIGDLPNIWQEIQLKLPDVNLPDLDVVWPKMMDLPRLNLPQVNLPGFPEIPGLPEINLPGLGSKNVSISTEREVVRVKDQTFKFKSVEEFELYQKSGGAGFRPVAGNTDLNSASGKNYSWDGAKEFRTVTANISKVNTRLTGRKLEEQTTQHSYMGKLMRSVFSTSVHVLTAKETVDPGKETRTKVTTLDTRAESGPLTKNTTSTMAAIRTDNEGNFQEGMVAVDFNVEKIKDNASKEAFIKKETRRLLQVINKQNAGEPEKAEEQEEPDDPNTHTFVLGENDVEEVEAITTPKISASQIEAVLRSNIDKLLAEMEENKGARLGTDLEAAKTALGEQGLSRGLKELEGTMFNEVGFSATYNNIHAEVSAKNIQMVRLYMLLEQGSDKKEIVPSRENTVIQISSQQGASFGVGAEFDLAIASVKAMVKVAGEHNRANTVETASHTGTLNHVYHSEVYQKAKLGQLETEVNNGGNLATDLLAMKKLHFLTKDLTETGKELAGISVQQEDQIQIKSHLQSAFRENTATAEAIFSTIESRISNQLPAGIKQQYAQFKAGLPEGGIREKVTEVLKFAEKLKLL